jgi:hypothetical protein
MIIEVKVPQLSESVAEATLSAWHVKEGDAGATLQRTQKLTKASCTIRSSDISPLQGISSQSH